MTHDAKRILVADDHPDVIAALQLLFKAENYEVMASSTPSEALDLAKATEFDVALIDLNYSEDTTSGREGLRLLQQLLEIDPDLPVIVMTAWSSVSVAVKAMHQGAGDFIEKPWDNQRLLSIVRNQIALGKARRSEKRLAAENAVLRGSEPEFIARSPAILPALELLRRVAPSQASVLITGEHGTGKSLIARHLHRMSDRAAKPLVTVNVGGLSEAVFESEMFGHMKGAFTDAREDRVGRFEMADGGTLFLDEIANIPLAQQAKLLRVLEEGEFERVGSSRTQTADVRVIAATNAKLSELSDESAFRQDLLFRLNTVEINLPPLRHRIEDIEPLALQFLDQSCRRYGGGASAFSKDALAALKNHRWPGNVRELKHVVERAFLMSSDDHIGPGALQLNAVTASINDLEAMPLEQAERLLIEAALQRNGHNVLEAARELGLSRSAMYRRLEKHGLNEAV